LHLKAFITSLPPDSAYFPIPDHPPIRLWDLFGVHWGWLCHARHQPGEPHDCGKPRGACCDEGTGDCRITTVDDCVGPNERYNGDNSSCVLKPCECCLPPIRGDIGASGEIDIADLVYLIDYTFNDGPGPPCFMEADINHDKVIDISDLVWLVEYLFAGGRSPCPCDCSAADCPPETGSKIREETIQRWSAREVPNVLSKSRRY